MANPRPISLDYAGPPTRHPFRPLDLLGIAVTAVFAGVVVGASTNAINGAVSPTYFMIIMGWGQPGVWFDSVQQGILEGFVLGVFLSFILTIAIGLITRASCTYLHAVRWLAGVVIAVYAFWAVGGVLGVLFAAASPKAYQDLFIGRTLSFWQTLRFAWVGGTIWGAYFGGLVSVIVGLIIFALKWRRQLMEESASSASEVR